MSTIYSPGREGLLLLLQTFKNRISSVIIQDVYQDVGFRREGTLDMASSVVYIRYETLPTNKKNEDVIG